MVLETEKKDSGVISHARKVPLDVRIVAYYLYATAVLFLVLGAYAAIGSAEPHVRPILLGSVIVTSRLTDSVETLASGIGFLFCAWALMRRIRFAWWFSLVFLFYCLTDAALVFSEYPLALGGGSIAIDIVLIAWLFFRRGLYLKEKPYN